MRMNGSFPSSLSQPGQAQFSAVRTPFGDATPSFPPPLPRGGGGEKKKGSSSVGKLSNGEWMC